MRPAVSYSAKSTWDPKGSLATQRSDGRFLAEENELELVAEYKDENATGYKASRGSGLTDAMAHAEQLAAEHGECALLIQHSDRLARGDVITARHLLEYAIWALKSGVRIISKQNPEAFGNLVVTALYGDLAHAESRRKRDAVKDGMLRRVQKGLHPGGRRSIGFRLVRIGEEKLLRPVADEVPIVVRIFTDFVAGKSMTAIARELELEGVPTRFGAKWRQPTISSILRNPIYIGFIYYAGETYEGEHEGILDPQLFADAQALIAARPSNGVGRPSATKHLFRGGMLECGACGGRMVPRSNQRGSWSVYVCEDRALLGVDYCPMGNVPRLDVDTATFNYFAQVALDVEGTRRAAAERSELKLAEIAGLVAQAEKQERTAADRYARVKRAFQDDKITAEDWSEQRSELIDERDAAQAELASLRASQARTLAEAELFDAEDETIATLAEIRQAIVGDVQSAEGIDAVRATLQRLFSKFVIHRSVPERVHVEMIVEPELWIEPIVRPDVAERYGPGDMPKPRKQPLDVAVQQSTDRLAEVLKVPFGPIPVATGDRSA